MGGDTQAGSAEERFAANLRALRERAGMSQSALAAAMAERGRPWHQSTVYRVEAGKQPVSFGEATDLAAILRTSLDRFTWSTPEASETEFVQAAGTRVRVSYEDVAVAVCRLLADIAAAERVIASSAGSRWPRVREALEDTAARVREYGLEAAISEGIGRYDERHGEEEDDDDGTEDPQGQPGVVDQRRAQ